MEVRRQFLTWGDRNRHEIQWWSWRAGSLFGLAVFLILWAARVV